MKSLSVNDKHRCSRLEVESWRPRAGGWRPGPDAEGWRLQAPGLWFEASRWRLDAGASRLEAATSRPRLVEARGWRLSVVQLK